MLFEAFRVLLEAVLIEWASALVPPTPFFRIGWGSASERPQMGVNSLGQASEVTLLQTLVHVNARSSVMSKAKGAHVALAEKVEGSKDVS